MYKCIHNSTYIIKMYLKNAFNLVGFEKVKRKDAHILILCFHPEFVLIFLLKMFWHIEFLWGQVSLSIFSNVEIAFVNSTIGNYN